MVAEGEIVMWSRRQQKKKSEMNQYTETLRRDLWNMLSELLETSIGCVHRIGLIQFCLVLQ